MTDPDGTFQPRKKRGRLRGTDDLEYEAYLLRADDGRGGDVTNDNKPLMTLDEWMDR